MSVTYQGSCHCQEVSYSVELDEAITSAFSCNCSMCHRKGTLLTFVPKKCFTLQSGEDNLSDYQFGKKTVHHYFCSTCGVTSFAYGSKPDGTEVVAINVRCLEGLDINEIKINLVNGKDF